MAKADAVDIGTILGSKMDHFSLTSSGSHSCVVCHEPAQLRCGACSYTEAEIDEHKPTWYCSKDCQKQDWLSHKSHCSEISDFNQLVRAAHIVQKVFYHYRKLWFDVPVDRIVFKGDNIRIHQGDAKDKMLFDFPTKLVKSCEVEEALLSFCACDDGLGRMHNLMALVISGIYKSIKEVCFDVKNPKRVISVQLFPGKVEKPILYHSVLKVTLNSGKDYVVDVAGAQFGWHSPVLPWQTVLKERVEKVRSTYAFGNMKEQTDNWIIIPNPHQMAAFCNAQAGGDQVDKLIGGWLKAEGITMTTIMKLNPDEYNTKTAEMVKAVSEGLATFIQSKPREIVIGVKAEKNDFVTVITLTKGDGSLQKIDRMF